MFFCDSQAKAVACHSLKGNLIDLESNEILQILRMESKVKTMDAWEALASHSLKLLIDIFPTNTFSPRTRIDVNQHVQIRHARREMPCWGVKDSVRQGEIGVDEKICSGAGDSSQMSLSVSRCERVN